MTLAKGKSRKDNLANFENILTISEELEKYTWPVCDVCDKKVDHYAMGNEFISGSLVFIAKCHNEEDMCKITYDDSGFFTSGMPISSRCFVSRKSISYIGDEINATEKR